MEIKAVWGGREEAEAAAEEQQGSRIRSSSLDGGQGQLTLLLKIREAGQGRGGGTPPSLRRPCPKLLPRARLRGS